MFFSSWTSCWVQNFVMRQGIEWLDDDDDDDDEDVKV